MHVERLEGRRLLSASPIAAAKPRPVAEHIVASQTGATLTLDNVNSVQIVDNGGGSVTVFDKSRTGSDPLFRQDYSGVSSLVVNGTKRDDNISAALTTVDATFNGGGGSDGFPVSVVDITDDAGNVLVPATSDVVINAGPGADILSGNNFGSGTYVFNGQSGRDALILIGEAGHNIIFNQ
jgi:hypothetical protein